jgi:hypothetical protein
MGMYLAIGDQPGINIQSTGYLTDLISCPLNDDIYRTFTSFKGYQIISCVDYFPKAEYPGRSFRSSETAAYTAGNDYKTAKILP